MCRSLELLFGDIELYPFNPDPEEPRVVSQAEIFRSFGAFEVQAQQVPATQYFNRDGQRVFIWFSILPEARNGAARNRRTLGFLSPS